MSWQKCDSARPYPLAFPVPVRAAAGLLHGVIAVTACCLVLPADAVVLLVLCAWRGWRRMHARELAVRHLAVSMDKQLRLRIHEHCRSGESPGSIDAGHARAVGQHRQKPVLHASGFDAADDQTDATRSPPSTENAFVYADSDNLYTLRRSFRVPGCACLSVENASGKHLEILVFYRYDRRQFYRRLQRFLVLKSAPTTSHFVA